MNYIQALCWGTLILVSCKQQHRVADSNPNYELHGDTIIIPSRSGLTARIKVDTLAERPYSGEMIAAGIVKAIPNQYAEIASPFSGRIIKSYMQLGMTVRPGAPLFEISSQGFMAAQKTFFQEKAQLQLAEKVWKRQQDLLDHGVGSQKEYDEAQTSYNVEKQEFENAANGIRLFKADPEHMLLGQPLIVRAPIAGKIIANRIVVGQFLREDDTSIATLAELSTIWVAAYIKEKDILAVRSMETCEITGAGFAANPVKGRIHHIGDVVDEQTRSIQVMIACNNPSQVLKPGMYVTIDFKRAPVSSILIPQGSLLQTKKDRIVFRQIRPGTFVRQAIQVAGSEQGKIIVRSGLAKNDIIISDGAFYLSGAK